MPTLIRVEVISVLNVSHLRMRRQKLPYNSDGFDKGPSVAQPRFSLYTFRPFFKGSYGFYKDQVQIDRSGNFEKLIV